MDGDEDNLKYRSSASMITFFRMKLLDKSCMEITYMASRRSETVKRLDTRSSAYNTNFYMPLRISIRKSKGAISTPTAIADTVQTVFETSEFEDLRPLSDYEEI